VQKVGVDDRWLAYRQGFANGSTRLVVQSLDDLSGTRKAASARSPGQVGRPALSGDLLVYHVAQDRSSWISSLDLSTGRRRRLRSASDHQLLNPSSLGGPLLSVDVPPCPQPLPLDPPPPGPHPPPPSLPP